MIKNVSSKWIQVWGAEQIQNQILKGLLAFVLILCAVQTTIVCILALKAPTLIAVTNDSTQVLAVVPPNEELLLKEIRRTLTEYAQLHHTWDWQTVDGRMIGASKMVASEYSEQFLRANASQAKLAKEKKLSQTLYVSDLTVDLKEGTATLKADRIIIVEGLRAANPMVLKIGFELGARTLNNPEGVYVTSEDLVTVQAAQ